MFRFSKTTALAAGCALIFGIAGGTAAQGGDEAAIKYRRNIMRSIGGHTGAIAQIVKGETPHKSHLANHARALSNLLDMVPDAFEQRTSGGETRAKSEIWTDAKGFKQAHSEAAMAAKAFAEAASSGNDGEIAEKLKPVFEGCKGCHRNYREKKD